MRLSRKAAQTQSGLSLISWTLSSSLKTLRSSAALLSSIADVESGFRFLVTGSYLTFYQIENGGIYIDRILYGRRDYLRILFGNTEDK